MTDAIVMPMPTSAAITIVRDLEHGLGVGESGPGGVEGGDEAACDQQRRRATPNNVASTPSTKASAEIIRRTWRPDAPTARRSASSRSRWPIVIWNTLLMMNALTNAVMKAKTSRPVPNTPTNWLTSSAVSWATCSPVTTSVCGGRMSSIARCTVGDVGAVGDRDVDRVDLAVGAEVHERGVEVEGHELRPAEAVGAARARPCR